MPLVTGYASIEGHPQAHRVDQSANDCHGRLGHATGPAFYQCVVDDLLAQRKAAEAAGGSDFFPIVPHVVEPFGPDRSRRDDYANGWSVQAAQSTLLKDMLRNFTCDVADGGSIPVRSMTWEYRPPDPCAGAQSGGGRGFIHKNGFLPAGDDLPELSPGRPLTRAQAEAVCAKHVKCRGFTYHDGGDTQPQARYTIHFKSRADAPTPGDGAWHTYKRRAAQVDCRPGRRPPPPSTLRLQVDVLRESPPVYIVHDFATGAECDYMMNLTIPRMERSVVYGGGQAGQASNYRQSYSVNMWPDYDDESDVVTRMVRRKFAFAREVAEYAELIEGAGQEPLNSVYYKACHRRALGGGSAARACCRQSLPPLRI